MKAKLNFSLLQHRRYCAGLIMLHRLYYHLLESTKNQYLKPSHHITPRTDDSCKLALVTPQTNLSNTRHYNCRVKFLGHIIGREGIRPDSSKVKAIVDLKPSSSVHKLRSALGMVIYLTKFIPNMSHIAYPLNSLLSSKNHCVWATELQRSLDQLKRMLTWVPCQRSLTQKDTR